MTDIDLIEVARSLGVVLFATLGVGYAGNALVKSGALPGDTAPLLNLLLLLTLATALSRWYRLAVDLFPSWEQQCIVALALSAAFSGYLFYELPATMRGEPVGDLYALSGVLVFFLLAPDWPPVIVDAVEKYLTRIPGVTSDE